MKTLATLLRISLLAVLVTVLFWAYATMAQTETGTVSGLITDETGAAVPGAQVQLLNVQRGTTSDATTNGAGIYVFSAVEPGRYQIKVQKSGFKQIDLLSLIVNVQDHIEQNVRLQIGSVSESVTVNAEESHINTTDATVSTIVDRNFAENLPLNGRSFQTLINLTPGVIPVQGGAGTGTESGQFSVNGQRADSNYWTVDGVSANASSGTVRGGIGQTLSGAVGTTSVLGGTNSLVSVDALQEFRIQTSTFAPEFGRTPGAQISIVTRSGTNNFHGSGFDYLRNDKLDANNWFNCYTNKPCLPKAQERQNDFGGTFSGPIFKNRTFFFFSYEGLRLRLPATSLSTVPDAAARQSAVSAMQPILNAFPFDPKQPDLGNGIAQFNASYSNPGTLNASSLRIDHKLNDSITIFGRYNYAPSEITTRAPLVAAGSFFSLSTKQKAKSTAQQLTTGMSWSISPRVVNELRFNYSKTDSVNEYSIDDFGGAVPFTPPSIGSFTSKNSLFSVAITSLKNGQLNIGTSTLNVQHQLNVVETLTSQLGRHALKVGVDFRRLSPTFTPNAYSQGAFFFSMAQADSGISPFGTVATNTGGALLFRNLGVFAQDTWRVLPVLTVTYGVRWDTDFVPESTSGTPLPALTAFNAHNLPAAHLAPAGTPIFHTQFGNVAPRLGIAYQMTSRPNWDSVVRGGFGVFYDLATSEALNASNVASYPFVALVNSFGQPFPFTGAAAAPPAIVPPTPSTPQQIGSFDPNLKSPYTLEWNVSFEQGLGPQQSVSLSYVGAAGRRLLQTGSVISASFIPYPGAPNPPQLDPSISVLAVNANSGTSDYNALQLQFKRRLTKGLQALASYTWSHSIDTGSTGSSTVHSNQPSGPDNSGDRASSDFDVRHAVSTGLTYSLPTLRQDRVLRAATQGWSLQSIVQAHTAPPVSPFDSFFFRTDAGFNVQIRPDINPGVPQYLHGSQFPGGKAFNPAAFVGPPSDNGCNPQVTFPCDPLRQGNAGRNSLRGFGLFQWDLGVHREFSILDSLKLQFRAEMFNVLNHPNFGPPVGDIANPNFGVSSQMLGQYLGGGAGGAGLNSLYQTGVPRSIQMALKLTF